MSPSLGLTHGRQILELHHVIVLSDLLPNLSPTIIRVLEDALEAVEPQEEYMKKETNSSWIVGACLSCLARRKRSEWASHIDFRSWTETIIKKWNWSGYVLDSLFALMSVK